MSLGKVKDWPHEAPAGCLVSRWARCVCLSVCVCLHVIVSLLVPTCLPNARFVWNSWFPPSAAPLHEQLQNVWMCVWLPCVDHLFFFSALFPQHYEQLNTSCINATSNKFERLYWVPKPYQSCSVTPLKKRNLTLISGVSKTVNVLFFISCTI